MHRHVNSICCTDCQVDSTKGMIPLLENIPNERTERKLELLKDNYGRLTTTTPSMNMDYNPDIMRHKVALCMHVTLLHFTQVRVKEVTK